MKKVETKSTSVSQGMKIAESVHTKGWPTYLSDADEDVFLLMFLRWNNIRVALVWVFYAKSPKCWYSYLSSELFTILSWESC